LFIVIKRL